MKGWLAVNGFLQSAKFNEIYAILQNSAKQLNINMRLVTTDSLLCEANSNFSAWEKPDFVLFWDKDVSLAKRLEQAGFVLFNNAAAVEICDSKTLTAMRLCSVVPMPKTLFSPKTFPSVGYTSLSFVKRAVEILGLPLIVKEAYGSFGEQVHLCSTLQEAENLVKKLAGRDFLFQQFVAESCGRDVRLNVVGGKVVNAILRHSESDFRSNVTLGGKMQRYEPTAAEVEIAERACREIGLDFAGVDVLLGNNGPLLCEVNSNPHFKSTLDCTGVDLSKNILQHIAQSVRGRREA